MNDLKKIGYLAWLGVNYGSTLQAYALNKSITKLGYTCEVIGADIFINGIKPDVSLKESEPKKYDWLLTKYNFNQFMFKHFKFNKNLGTIPGDSILSIDQLHETEFFDAFICGSDQIWKPGGFWFHSKQYLQFAPTYKRVAYAPSVGWKTIPDKFKQNVKQWKDWLSSIPYLSTRELTGTAQVHELTGRFTETVVDPTMLVSPNEWVEYMDNPIYSEDIKNILGSGKKYLLAYFLDHADIFRDKVIALADRLELEIIWLTGRDNVGPVQVNCTDTDPAGFVHLVSNASFVCADGFHGTCFSLNFGKPVAYFTLNNDYDVVNDTRVQDLFLRMGVDPNLHTIIPSMSVDDIGTSYDFQKTREIIDRERKKSLKYLQDALEGAVENKGRMYDIVKSEKDKLIDNYPGVVKIIQNKATVKKYQDGLVLSENYKFNPDIWDVRQDDDCKLLIPKKENNDSGRFAYYLLPENYINNKGCLLKIRIYVKSSQIVNIHFANSNTRKHVIVYRLEPEQFSTWRELIIKFDKTNNNYDSIMVGARQFTGKDRAFGIRNIQLVDGRDLFKNEILPNKSINSSEFKHNSIMRVVLEFRCTGCGVCSLLCPKNAIKMVENEEGFLCPDVDQEKCIDCGICLKKCISENPSYKNAENPKCFAAMASDDVRKVSSSGGVFTVAANYVLERNGYVCGAAYDEDYRVHHIIIKDKTQLSLLRGSKYMQSNLKNVFREIKDLLKQGFMVLFTGMPCQVAGLYSFLNRDYDNLITIDILCHGISSSKVFSKYHNDVLGGKSLVRLEFKEKEPWGWHAGVNAYFKDNTKYSKPLETDLYFMAYLKSLAKNKTCGTCVSNHLPRQGDITIGDFWGLNSCDPKMNDGKGTSVLLVNNEKGNSFFNAIKNDFRNMKEEPLTAAIKGNRVIKAPYALHKNRDLFFKNLNNYDFSSLVLGCLRNNFYNVENKLLLSICKENEVEYFYLARHVVNKFNNRTIVTYGKSSEFETILRNLFGLTVAFYLSSNENSIDNAKTFSTDFVKNKSSELFIVGLNPAMNEDLMTKLEANGYSDLDDFIFRVHRPIVLKNLDLSKGRYEDQYGNTIDGWNGTISSVIFRGSNCHVLLSKGVSRLENLSMDLSSNTLISLGENCRFNSSIKMTVLGYSGLSEIIFGKNCRLTDGYIKVYNHPEKSSIFVDDDTTFETRLELHANSGKKIKIGKDCMFSHGVELWAGDGHSCFDVNTGKNINSNYYDLPDHKNLIVIGDHVWIGKEAFVMHGTSIGKGSIVGARSVVKGNFPNNCTIAGNPAKCVKHNIAWSRQMCATDMNNSCGDISNIGITA